MSFWAVIPLAIYVLMTLRAVREARAWGIPLMFVVVPSIMILWTWFLGFWFPFLVVLLTFTGLTWLLMDEADPLLNRTWSITLAVISALFDVGMFYIFQLLR